MKTYKMNVVSRKGKAQPECTACGHRFNTDYADNPYQEMCSLAMGEHKYCPKCGAEYVGCQVEGIDLEKCDSDTQRWIQRGYYGDR